MVSPPLNLNGVMEAVFAAGVFQSLISQVARALDPQFPSMECYLFSRSISNRLTRGQCQKSTRVNVWTKLCQLATCMVYDLCLNKPAMSESSWCFGSIDARGCFQKSSNPQERTVADRRAVLGVFFITSL